MTEVSEVTSPDVKEVYAEGLRHLAVKDHSNAVSTLGRACELLATKHGEQADECAEAYLWYGKALLALSREESGVLGDRVPQGGDEDKDSEEDQEENEENDVDSETGENNQAESKENGEVESEEKEQNDDDKKEENKAHDINEAGGSRDDQPGTSNGDHNGEESVTDLGDEDDVDNLQLAWEMLDLSRSILEKRVSRCASEDTRALLADVHLTLGEVALESETYDKAVVDMQNCLVIQKELYSSDDRRIAETHYEIGLAHSLSSNFEEAITHFKNAANILETRIKNLESPGGADDATLKKHGANDPHGSVANEIKELKDLLPEIQDKIQDMIEYKAETMRKLREQLCGANGSGAGGSAGAGPARQAADISHLVRRKRKPDDEDTPAPAPKNAKS